MGFIKVQAAASMYLYLPLDTPQKRPLVRPAPKIPSYSEECEWTVTYKNGVSGRKSHMYEDRDVNDDGSPGLVLKQGERFRGRALEAFNAGNPEMILVTDRKTEKGGNSIVYVPMKTKQGAQVCEKWSFGGPPSSGGMGPPPSGPPS